MTCRGFSWTEDRPGRRDSTCRLNVGLTVALEKTAIHPSHEWVVCESVRRRINKSLSDLDGTDAYIHGGIIKGVFREMGNAFVASRRQPTVAEMMQIYRVLRTQLDGILQKAGAEDPFNAECLKHFAC